MKKFLPWAALFALVIPCVAQAQLGHGNPLNAYENRAPVPAMTWEPLYIRHTVSNPSTVGTNWFQQPAGVSYVDSVVFRKASSAAATLDTTVAIRVNDLPYYPRYANVANQATRTTKQNCLTCVGTSDSLLTAYPDTLDQTPWITLRFEQDTLSYAYSTGVGGGSTLDSVYVGAQVSYDGGSSWQSVAGTPTRKFIAAGPIPSAGDGLQDPVLFAVQYSIALDMVGLNFQCAPQAASPDAAPIINRTLCACQNAMVRFIFSIGAGVGQFRAEIAHW